MASPSKVIKQKSLDGFFGGSPTKQVAASPPNVIKHEDELKQAVKEATASPSKVIKLEDELRKSADDLGRVFVPNGSRDRHRHIRKHVGGRPKKFASPIRGVHRSTKEEVQ